jgi:hypothetical protein
VKETNGCCIEEYCNVSAWTLSLTIWIFFTLSRCFLKIFCPHLLLGHSFGPFQSDFPLQLCVHFLYPTVEWVALLFCILGPRSQICALIQTVPTLLNFHYDVFFIPVVLTASSSSGNPWIIKYYLKAVDLFHGELTKGLLNWELWNDCFT